MSESVSFTSSDVSSHFTTGARELLDSDFIFENHFLIGSTPLEQLNRHTLDWVEGVQNEADYEEFHEELSKSFQDYDRDFF